MNWEVATAKNGEATLTLNNYAVYSKYRPREDAWKWVDSEFEESKEQYFLIGLGLGYHAERLAQLAKGKRVIVYFFEKIEYELFLNNNESEDLQIEIIHDLKDFILNEKTQVLISGSWIRAIGQDHSLFAYLEDIKINQVTFKKTADLMKNNFNSNMRISPEIQSYPKYKKEIACIVASGPSLNKTVSWLKEIQDKVEIFAVGSALKLLLLNGITPTAAIISDAKHDIIKQIEGSGYLGPLYFLSTANAKTVIKHEGDSYIIFQQGYPLAEVAAEKHKMPLLETGGSVSTVAISLLEYLGFEEIILFGQDLGFVGNQTHAKDSTSGRAVSDDLNIREVLANDGSFIHTTPNLQVYTRWIENKAKRMSKKLYTTSEQGVFIPKVPYINQKELNSIVNSK
ncbi:motility associated factor glycosyltransferase family protein [Lysinibacillus cavernae]|uniref:motility associated factor glycosyltransferase family protein n=1 Tax=Lysinibacillus cavernae TaxID=2666135 RepID=UPI0012D9B8A0|nr:6-hydroxymethylpterin diphosphokinase MptE-like protein [Lysinibacillus cavernae]